MDDFITPLTRIFFAPFFASVGEWTCAVHDSIWRGPQMSVGACPSRRPGGENFISAKVDVCSPAGSIIRSVLDPTMASTGRREGRSLGLRDCMPSAKRASLKRALAQYPSI